MEVTNRSAEGAEGERALSVSELTLEIKDLLETSFSEVWVAGEISNVSRPRSGHCYLTLKDAKAQLPGVLWRSTAARVRFDLVDGLEVICRGRVEVYPPHGKYQLIIRSIRPKGIGALELAFRQLHEKLAAEGLFDAARKRPLPRFVERLAVVTSPTGAAIRDFVEVLRRRWRGVHVMIVPVRVQGKGAADEIAAAIAQVNRLAEPVDCLVVTRGGGSLEDLWAFNEEAVVRAISASHAPVVSAVGHEIDVTLADLVADLRALTPSEAAERIVPAADEILAQLRQYDQRLSSTMRLKAAAARARLEALAGRRLFRQPLEQVHQWRKMVDEIASRGDRAIRARLELAQEKTDSLAAQLNSLSPLAVLARGYSVTQPAAGGPVIQNADQLNPGDLLRTRFAQGQALSRVEQIEPEN